MHSIKDFLYMIDGNTGNTLAFLLDATVPRGSSTKNYRKLASDSPHSMGFKAGGGSRTVDNKISKEALCTELTYTYR